MTIQDDIIRSVSYRGEFDTVIEIGGVERLYCLEIEAEAELQYEDEEDWSPLVRVKRLEVVDADLYLDDGQIRPVPFKRSWIEGACGAAALAAFLDQHLRTLKEELQKEF